MLIQPLDCDRQDFRRNAGSIDPTTYLRFHRAYSPGNSPAEWLDESGHNKHLTQATASKQPQLVAGAIGTKQAYDFLSSGVGRQFQLGTLTTTQQEYSIHFVLRMRGSSNTYLYNGGHNRWLFFIGLNNANDTSALYQANTKLAGALNLQTGKDYFISYQLVAGAAFVEVNGVQVLDGLNYQPDDLGDGTLSGYLAGGGNEIDGMVALFAVSSPQTGSERQALRESIAAELGTTFTA